MKRAALVLGLVLFLAAVAILLRANITPSRPAGWSQNAKYFKTPMPYRLAFPGMWFECWYDAKENADWCRAADYYGKERMRNRYLSPDGNRPLREEEMGRMSDSTLFGNVHFENGNALWPVGVFDKSSTPPAEPHPPE